MPEGGPRSAEAEAFLEAYRALQPGRDQLPRKRDLTLERMLPCIRNVFIVEATAEGFLFRLYGTEIVAIAGRDLTGQYLHEVLSGADLDHIRRLKERCLAERLAIVSQERLVFPRREYVEVEVLRTPWADDTGEARFVAGTLARLPGIGSGRGPKVINERYLEILRDRKPRIEIPVGKTPDSG